MKRKTYNKKSKKIKKVDDFEDLVFHDVFEHEEHEEETEILHNDEVDLVEEALAEAPVEEVVEPTSKKPVDKTKFYVDPKKFDEEIVSYYKSGKMSNDLAEMVSKISHKLSYAPNFINYTYREEMVGDGVIRMMKALMAKKYNRDKGTNPFSYFTRIAFNAFRNRIKKEKHMADTHQKYQDELMMMSQNYNVLMKNNNIRINKERERH